LQSDWVIKENVVVLINKYVYLATGISFTF